MRTKFTAVAALLAGAMLAGAAPVTAPKHEEGKLANGAAYELDVPAGWNGTLLLWSHGYSPVVGAPQDAPPPLKAWLLQQGYGLAGSAYSQPGWAVEQAMDEQKQTIEVFTSRYGKPKRIIAWGHSMGGLVSVALAEREPHLISGALPMCGSLAGSIGMMNEGLAAAFAFKQLLGEGSEIRLVNIGDDRRNASLVNERVKTAMATPEGRARLALVLTLAQIPHWVDPKAPEPAAGDDDAALAEQAKALPSGIFLPRQDQERRAGGAFSWTAGLNFADLLRTSGERAYVARLYKRAGLSLDTDLKRLSASPPVTADPAAVRYMAANYSPTGVLRVPTLAIHTAGDGVTVPPMMNAYGAAVAKRGLGANYRTATIGRAGHCTFTPAETGAALKALERRLDGQGWQVDPASLNALAAATTLGEARFAPGSAAPFLVPYIRPPGSEKAK